VLILYFFGLSWFLVRLLAFNQSLPCSILMLSNGALLEVSLFLLFFGLA
jgi:hypothetical protein